MQVTEDAKIDSHASNDVHNMHVCYPRFFGTAMIRIIYNRVHSFPGFQS